MAENGRVSGLDVEADESVVVSSDPKNAVRPLMQLMDGRRRSFRRADVDALELVAVVSEEAAGRPEPEEAFTALQQRVNHRLPQSVLLTEPRETRALASYRGGCEADDEEESPDAEP